MGRLHIKTADCNYKKDNRWLKEHFINGINNEEIMQEIIKGLSIQRNTSTQVVIWAQRVKVKRAQKKTLDKMKDIREFDHIQSGKKTERDNDE